MVHPSILKESVVLPTKIQEVMPWASIGSLGALKMMGLEGVPVPAYPKARRSVSLLTRIGSVMGGSEGARSSMFEEPCANDEPPTKMSSARNAEASANHVVLLMLPPPVCLYPKTNTLFMDISGARLVFGDGPALQGEKQKKEKGKERVSSNWCLHFFCPGLSDGFDFSTGFSAGFSAGLAGVAFFFLM